jgi:hypothetical protein
VAQGDDVEVRFGANIDDLKSKLDQVSGIFQQVTSRFVALAAVAAGGAAFKSFIDTANELNSSAERVSRTLNITTEAGTLSEAIGDIAAEMGTSTSIRDYESAFTKFNRTLMNNSEELRKYGVDVDAVASGQKTSNEVFMEALQVVNQYRPGIDQTQVAMKLFGRSIGDVQVLMKLSKERMDDARSGMAALNRTVTAEGIEAARQYRVAMDNVGDVLEGLQKTIGEAIMPAFTTLANFLTQYGPAAVQVMEASINAFTAVVGELMGAVQALWELGSEVFGALGELIGDLFGGESITAMEVFKNALRIVHGVFVAFRIGVQEIAAAISVGISLLAENFQRLAAVARAALSWDWEGVKSAWKSGVAAQEKILTDGMARMVGIAEKGREDLDKALLGESTAGPTKTVAKTAATGGNKQADIGKDDALAQARLAVQKARDQSALQLQQEYLRQASAIYDNAYQNDLVTVKEFYDAKLAIEMRGIDATLEMKRKEAADANKAASGASKEAQRLKFAADEARLIGEIAVLEAKRGDAVRANAAEYAAEAKKRNDAIANIKVSAVQAAAQSELQTERASADQLKALGLLTAESRLESERAFAERSYQITVANLAAKRELARNDQVALAQIQADAEAAERDHQARLLEIDRSAQLEKAKYSLDAQRSVKDSFASTVRDLLGGTKKLGDAFRDFGMSVLKTFDNLIAQRLSDRLFDSLGGNKVVDMLVKPFEQGMDAILASWLGKEAAQTAATTAGTAARTAAEETASGQSLMLSAATAVKRIAIAAWEAAASVYASIAAIPVVGPFLAPAMAIGAGVAVLGFAQNIASAEGGWWQVPGDQMAQIHKNEMVLPSAEADGLRSMVSGGKGGKGDTINIHAVDSQSIERLFMRNGKALVGAIKKAGRDNL